MRDIIFAFWMAAAAITAVIGGISIGACWLWELGPWYILGSILSTVCGVMMNLTVAFIVDSVGRK